MTESLKVNGITKIYAADVFKRKLVILDDLSIEFPLKKCTGLFGHNGAGKTTLIRLIFGISRPNRGNITIADSDISALNRRKIGYMPEVDKTASTLTPREIITSHCMLFALDDIENRTKNILEKVGLLASWNKKSSSLSKGMGRRLAFAQATVHEPDFLILDEPFSGLDPLGRADMHNWITEQKAKQTTVILCSHELRESYSLCDEFNILNKGKLVYSTLDSGKHFKLPAPLFAITIADVSEEEFQNLQAEANLPNPLLLRHHSDDNHLWAQFDSYESAYQWLRFLTQKDLRVKMFGDDGQDNQQVEMLKFFKLGEQSA
ncbi:MAG: ABC transporter ATP-binding protein [Pseudomonadota bacterium]|nr:ABC transporter ATP-binding protein [Pseudomonadota bacterium]